MSFEDAIILAVCVTIFGAWCISDERKAFLSKRKGLALHKMENLLARYDEMVDNENVMNTTEIINKLFSIHKIYAVPTTGESPRNLFGVMRFIQRLHCTLEDLEKLGKMLSWPEIKKPEYDKVRLVIVEIIKDHGNEDQLLAMRKHMRYLNKVIKHFGENDECRLTISEETTLVMCFIDNAAKSCASSM